MAHNLMFETQFNLPRDDSSDSEKSAGNGNSQELASQLPFMTQKIDLSSSLSNAMDTDSETDVINETQMDDLSPHSQRRRKQLLVENKQGYCSNVNLTGSIDSVVAAHDDDGNSMKASIFSEKSLTSLRGKFLN
jgi:hypothetical protein